MSDKVQKALEERKKRKEEASKKSSTDKVSAALEARKDRLKSNASSLASDIQERYNSTIGSYNSYLSNNTDLASGKYSEGIDLKSVLDDQRERNLAVSKLIRDIEAYRGYLGEDESDTALENLKGISDGYRDILSNADTLSKYKTNEEYEQAVKEQEKLGNWANPDYIKTLSNQKDTYSSIYDNYENYFVPKAGTMDKEKTQKSGVITYYNKADEEAATKERDAWLANVTKQALGVPMTAEELAEKYNSTRLEYAQAQRYSNGLKLTNDALNAEDFAEKSQYVSTKAEGFLDKLTSDALGYNDTTYEYINNVDGYRDAYKEKHSTYSKDNIFDDGESSYEEKGYDYLTNDEIAVYNYYYATEGKEKAEEFLNNIQETLNARKASTDFREIEGHTFEEIVFGVEAGLDQFKSGMKNLFNTNDDYIPSSATQMTSGMVREDLADDGFKILGNSIGQIGYDLVNTTSNMLPSILTSAALSYINPALGSAIGTGLMGASASGNAYAEMLNLGYDKGQARLYSGLVGASEATLQYLLGGIGKLGGKLSSKVAVGIANNFDNAFARVAIKLGGNALGEFTEEYLQEVLDPIFKNMTLGTDEDVKLFSTEALYSGVLGALSAGILEGGSTMSSDIQTTKLGKSVQGIDGGVERLKNLGTTFSADTVAYQIADKVTNETGAYKIGLLLQEAGATLSEQNVSDITIELTKKGLTERDAKKLAKTYQAFLNNEMSLSDEQVEVLEGLNPLADVLRNNIIGRNTSVYQRTREFDDIYKLATEMETNTEVSPTPQAEAVETSQNFTPYSQEYVDSVVKEFETMGMPAEHARIMAEKKLSSSLETISTPTEEKAVESKFEVSAEGKTLDKKSGEIVGIKNIESISSDGVANLALDGGMVVKASDLSFGSDAEALFVENIGAIKIGKNPISTASANALYQAAMTSFKANPNMSASEAMSLIKGLEESYVFGAYNFGRSELSTRNEDGSAKRYAGELSQTQRAFAYELGTKDRVSEVERDQKVIDELKAKGKPSKKSLGKVIFEKGANVDESTFTATQKANLDGIKLLAELSSVEFHVFRSNKVGNTFKYTMPDGTVRTANGWFVAGTNEIWVDLNAGNFGEGTMIRTAAHEISHYIKQWSPQKWKAMADLLMKSFAENGVDTESMLNRQIAKIKKRYTKKNMPSDAKLLDMAHEELVSDALSDMLTDGSIVNFIAEVKAKDRNLAQKILDAIKSLLKKWGLIIDDYKGRDLDTTEAQELSKLEDTFKKLQEMYQDAFMDANETVATIGVRNLADFAEAKNTEGEELFQYRAMEADEDTYRDMLKKWGKMTDTQINNLFTTVDRAMDIIKDNLEVLDYAWESDVDDRAFSPVKPNSDSLYQVSLDFSTLCRKRILQQTIQAQLQEALNQPLTREEGIAIRDALMALQEEGRQIEVACALCYVESARMKSPTQIKKFLNNRETVLKDFFAGKSGGSMKDKIKRAEADAREKLHKENPNGIKGKDGTMLDPRTASLKAMPKKYADAIRDAKKGAKESYKPTAEEQRLIDVAKGMTVSDFTSPEGLENLAKNYPALFDAYTSYVRNATKSKGIEGDTWWRAGDSQKIGDVLIANMNRENGLRSQSWSDFQVIHILDYIAATIELSTRNAKEQAYSKVPDYVELMGQTGVMINMSLIPTREFNGKLDYDSVEGMAYKRALELREKYPATAGTICIGIDNKQIQMLLADATIDYVIPYHKSGMAASIRKLMHIPTWSQYEEYQSEKSLSRSDAEAQAKKYGVKILSESDPNYHKHTSFSEWFDLEVAKQIAKMENANPSNKAIQKKYGMMYGGYMAMKNAANNYLKLCAERGIAPKFSHEKADFTAEDNYWKLLIDRKMVNNATGEIIEQQAIKPIFDEGEVLRILNDELERYPSVKADQDYATRKVTEKFLSGEIKSGMSAEAIAKVMKTPVDNITKTNIVASAEGETMLSDRDSEGNTLTKEQVEYFKDSKVRDKDGNLLVVYHGTPNGDFNTFKISDGAHNSLMAQYGAGYYFDSNKASAKRYTQDVNKTVANRNPKVFETYLNVKNPLVIHDEYLNGRKPVITKQQFNDVVTKGNYEWFFSNGMPFELTKYLEKAKAEIQQLPREEIIKHWVDMVYERAYFDSEILSAMVKAYKGDSILGVMKDVFGNDGVHVIDKYGEMWVAWDNSQIKETTNKTPTTDPDIRYSFRDSESGMANDALTPYDEELTRYIKQKGDYIVDSFDKLKEIVNLAFDNPSLKATAYFGIIDAKTLKKIKSSIPNLPKSSKEILFKEGRDYSIATTLDSIRHIVDEKSLSREDVINYLDRLADTILEFDSVAFNFYQKGNNKTPGLLFKKNFSDGTLVSFDLVSHNKRSIVLQTLYMDSADYQKKKSAETLPMQKANGNTSETQVGQTSADIIAEDSKYVKIFSERDTSTSNRAILANALEGTAQNDIEKNKLTEYKKKISLIEAEEQRLSEIQKQLFTKGGVEPENRKDLQFEAKQIANRINTYDRQLLNLESTTALKNVLNREKALAMKRQKQKDAEAMKKYKEKVAKTQRELLERNQESRKKAIESREKTAMRHKIQKVVSELNQLLLRGTKDKHVMIGLQKVVAEALGAVNMDTVSAEERIKILNEKIAKTKDPDVIASLTETRNRIQAQGDKMSDKLTNLKNAYNDIKNSDDPLIANSYDEVIASRLEYITEKVGNTPLRNMTLEQLEDVYDMYKMVLTTIRNSNKAFKNAKNESIATLGNRVMMEVEEIGGKKKYRLKGTEGIENFNWNNLKPIYAFSRIGSNTLAEVFNNVRAGEDTWAVDVTEAREFYLEQSKKYNYDSWDFNKQHNFTSTSGLNFELSLEQIMSLYAYSKREQAAEHLRMGGIVFDETTEVTIKNKLGIPLKFNPTEATAYNLSIETLADIVGKLTEEQKAFVDEMQSYLSTEMGEKGNEVSLEMYGVKLFKEKNYFPLKSATQFMAKAKEQQKGEIKIKNSGFSKETVQHANNPIVLTPFMDVWANHINEMSMYHAFVLPMEDFYRVFNYKTPTSDTMATESVEMFIQNAYGKGATQYIEQLLKDLNGGAISDPRETFSKALMSKFKKAAVMASLSVVVQQPTAMIRAMALVDMRHFGIVPIARGIVRTVIPKKHKTLWAEVKKYAPVAIIKEMGRFDTHMGRSVQDFVKAKEYKGLEKVKGFFTDSGYRDDVFSKLPALADEMAWVSIWEAIKRETVAQHKNLRPNSEEFLKVVGERFTEVITKTQVYDSVLSRSAFMRSKTAFMNMWTSFLAEPTTSINMLEDALRQGKRGNKKYAAKTIGAVYGSIMLNAMLVSLVYAARDDDEDETFTEKYLSRLTTELLDGINPITYLPLWKDAWSIAQGFDIERADMSLFADLVDTLQQSVKVISKDTNDMDEEELAEHQKEVADALWGIADSISSLCGLPTKNVRRDINGAINLFETLKTDVEGRKTTAGSLIDEMWEDVKSSIPVVGWLPNETKADKLYDAIVNGDTAYIERLKSGYKDDKAYESAVRKALRENDPRIKEAAEARINGDISEYARIVKAIKAEGFFSQDTIVASVNAEINAINKGEDTESSDSNKAKSMYKIDDYYASIVGGDQASAYVVKEDLINTDIANGKDRDEAEDSFNSRFASYVREEYEKGNLSNGEAEKMLVNYGEKSEEDAASKVQYWEFKQDYPDYDDLSEEAVDKYYNEVEPYGIGIDVYYDYSKQKSKCKGTDKNGDGKTDSGSVKAEVLWIINSLPISRSQKDVFYYLNGWSAKTLYEAPWH